MSKEKKELKLLNNYMSELMNTTNDTGEFIKHSITASLSILGATIKFSADNIKDEYKDIAKTDLEIIILNNMNNIFQQADSKIMIIKSPHGDN